MFESIKLRRDLCTSFEFHFEWQPFEWQPFTPEELDRVLEKSDAVMRRGIQASQDSLRELRYLLEVTNKEAER